MKLETLLFSVFCLLFAFLNMDILLLGIVNNPQQALRISRLDHFFLVNNIGILFHLSHKAANEQRFRWLIPTFYLCGILFIPITQSDYYFQGMVRYYWGFFAQKGMIFDVFSALLTVSCALSCFILHQAYQKSKTEYKRKTSKYLFWGMTTLIVLNLGNLPAVYGIEFYPSGNFTFIPVTLAAYALFNRYLAEVIHYLRSIAYHLLYFSLLAAGIFLIVHAFGENSLGFAVLLIAIGFHFLLKPLSLFLNALLNLIFPSHKLDLQQLLGKSANQISLSLSVEDISKILVPLMLNTLEGKYCWIVFANKGALSYQGNYFSKREEGGFFDSPVAPINAEHPAIQMLYEKQDMVLQEQLDQWLRERLLKNISGDLLSRTAVMIPVYFYGALIGIIGLSEKINGQLHSREELSFLRSLCLPLGSIIESPVKSIL
ncbi:hypothetical protein WDW89_02910 [Deltaproteobacteria bacterium TL4]